MSNTDKRELDIFEADRNFDTAYDERNLAWQYIEIIDEYKNYVTIRNKVYNPTLTVNWRLEYKNHEEALQAELDVYNKFIATEEYKIWREKEDKVEECREYLKRARDLDEKYFEDSRS